jgi:hypothetical protein
MKGRTKGTLSGIMDTVVPTEGKASTHIEVELISDANPYQYINGSTPVPGHAASTRRLHCGVCRWEGVAAWKTKRLFIRLTTVGELGKKKHS